MRIPRGILFDMDGTLTAPLLDFPAIKAELGIGNRPILESLAAMAPAERAAGEAILHRHEFRAAADSTLNPGCRELLDFLAKQGIAIALVTRNSRASVRTVLEVHRLPITILVTREDAPSKPDPAPLHLACQRLGQKPADVWMVGDGHFDIEAAVAAGIAAVWISHGRKRDFEANPWREMRNLLELHQFLAGAAQPVPHPPVARRV